MAYTTLASSLIEPGKPVVAEIFTTIKTDLDDHETRLLSVEGGASKVYVCDKVFAGLNALESAVGNTDNVEAFYVAAGFTFTLAKITLLTATTGSGTLELDVRVGNTIAAASTIFATKPTTTGTAVDTTATGTFSTTTATTGQFIVIDFSSIPTGCGRVLVTIIGEIS